MRVAYLILLCGLSVVVAGGCQTTGPGSQAAPLPDNVAIIPPAEDVAPEFAAYSGTWRGRWGDSLDSYLVVEVVEPPSAEVIYSVGTNAVIRNSEWDRYSGEFEDGQLVVRFNPGIAATFRHTDSDTLAAVYDNAHHPDWHATATFRRVD
ncbi:MAG: hypothetical protein KDA64_14995 [Rhodospirillaceae bacterium]|nr:hypothetical protein [Rhodospirillaceae bacterium]